MLLLFRKHANSHASSTEEAKITEKTKAKGQIFQFNVVIAYNKMVIKYFLMSMAKNLISSGKAIDLRRLYCVLCIVFRMSNRCPKSCEKVSLSSRLLYHIPKNLKILKRE